MAKMIPSIFDPKTASTAERRLFERFRDELPDQWIVLHSVGVSNHRNKPWAEIDFIAVGPPGVFCLEIKGGQVGRRNGLWLFTNKHGDIASKHEGPWQQVGSAAPALRNYLVNRNPTLSQIIVGSGVMLPDITFRFEGPDIDLNTLYDLRDTEKPLKQYFERLSSYWRDRLNKGVAEADGLISSQLRDEIVSLIRGEFEIRPALGTVVSQIKEALIVLTQEQLRIVHGASDNPRMLIKGGAGTGKTLLALEEAKKLASEGQRVLFCCFNKHLARYLAERTSTIPNLTVTNLHGHMHRLITDADLLSELDGMEEADLFQVVMPITALQAIEQLGLTGSYDALIVDEGQDLLTDAYVYYLESLLAGGLRDGIWRIFYDPNQNIFDGTSLSALTQIKSHRPAEFRLSVNCRNTQPIATHVALLSGIPNDAILKAEGPAVEVDWYRDAAHQKRELEKFLNRTVSDGVPVSEIVILSPSRTPSFMAATVSGTRIPVVRLDEAVEQNQRAFRYSTISSFKGLESDVVALVDIKELGTDRAAASIYVGASRARALLAIFIAEDQKDRLPELTAAFASTLARST